VKECAERNVERNSTATCSRGYGYEMRKKEEEKKEKRTYVKEGGMGVKLGRS